MDPSSVRLMLLRHAKSDWSDEGLPDIQRPLNHRGRKAAPQMALWMLRHRFVPDRIVCSTAVRTRETLQRMMEVWQDEPTATAPAPDIHFIDRLYLATPQTILEVAVEHAVGSKALLVIGHNPGMEMLATQLSQSACEMRTCTLVVFAGQTHWPEDWRDSGAWRLIAKERP